MVYTQILKLHVGLLSKPLHCYGQIYRALPSVGDSSNFHKKKQF